MRDSLELIIKAKSHHGQPSRSGAVFLQAVIFTLMLLSLTLSAANVRSVGSGNWTDPGIWSNNQVPGQGDNVVVDSGHVVIYDANSSAEVRMIHIRGKLEFTRSHDTRLDVGVIIISSRETVDVNADCSYRQNGARWDESLPTLEIGTFKNPIPRGINATIQLKYFTDMDADCAPGIMNHAGRMDIHGAPLNYTWVKLANSEHAGSTVLNLQENVSDWRPGDKIVITGTGKPDNWHQTGSLLTNGQSESEERTIVSVSGSAVTIDRPLSHSHRGIDPTYGEVANLSRNVVITSKDPNGVRGHTMYHYESKGAISYAEFSHLGKPGVLARYPIHYHVLRNSNRGSFVIGTSVWDSGNRFVTIHATDFLYVKDNVGYKSLGHGFFMEDGTEAYNLLENNLAILAYKTNPLPNQALPWDNNDGAGFWWANGRNAVINNVAAECDQYGFLFETRSSMNLTVLGPDGHYRSNQRVEEIPFIKFKGNEVHSTTLYGVKGIGNAQTNKAFKIEDQRIWKVWYAIRPDFWNWEINNLDIYRTSYGFYGVDTKAGKMVDYSATRSTNSIILMRDTPEGLITFEDVYVDSTKEYPFIIDGRNARNQDANVHVRNYSLNRVTNNQKGADSDDPQQTPYLNLYLHDWFGANQDAIVRPADQPRGSDLNWQNLPPNFSNNVRVAQLNEPWPNNPVQYVDEMPPATVILWPSQGDILPSNTTEITVMGTCIDESQVSSVTVNGVQATATSDNFLTWQATVPVNNNDFRIETRSTDQLGHNEVMGHSIYVGIGQSPTGIGSGDPVPAAGTFQLFENYPNPFNPETHIKFGISSALSGPSDVRINIYNVLGEKVRTLVNNETLEPGVYDRLWDARGDNGEQVSTGVYIYEMIARNRNTG
ncbi:MAG: hypothetical protein KDI06_22705, partial [Calditrichaeota bacterium]|nr:hypothetical protein [Calditrichota bacterium]